MTIRCRLRILPILLLAGTAVADDAEDRTIGSLEDREFGP